MSESTTDFLLDDFVSTYETVAELKLAIREGRLAASLARPGENPPDTGAELAQRVAARLAQLIEAQAKRVRGFGTEEQRRQQGRALYAAAALIDETFILELDWPGRNAWLDVLMEYRLFRTRLAGQRFFDLAEQLAIKGSRNAEQAGLAAIFLLALRLGFHGKYRGSSGEQRLEELRQRLLDHVEPSCAEATDASANRDERLFPQAYQFTLKGKDQRLAPLRPWLRAGAIGLLTYLILSSAIWLVLLRPFLNWQVGI